MENCYLLKFSCLSAGLGCNDIVFICYSWQVVIFPVVFSSNDAVKYRGNVQYWLGTAVGRIFFLVL